MDKGDQGIQMDQTELLENEKIEAGDVTENYKNSLDLTM